MGLGNVSAAVRHRQPVVAPIALSFGYTTRSTCMSEKLKVVSPEGLQLASIGAVSRHLDTLEGKTIGEVYNNHFKGEFMFETYRRLLKARFPGVKIIPFDKFPIVYVGGDPASQKKTAKDIAALAKEWEVDAVISGNGG